MFWRPSILVADEPRRVPTRDLAIASGGMVAAVKTASAIPPGGPLASHGLA
jgi:hypothetical protein